MPELTLVPTIQPLRGRVSVPADKSISHRAAILSMLADGDTRVENFLQSETTRATLNCLRQLGADIDEPSPNTLLVHGRGLRSLREPNDILFCAGSGTTMRLFAGVCAGQNFLSVLDGTPALKRRPMARVIEPLEKAGKTTVIPPKANRKHKRDYDKELYKARHLIENFFAKLKQFRAIATRYDKRAINFLAGIHLASIVIWLN